MKIINAVVSALTVVGWAAAILLSGVGAASGLGWLVMLAGFMIFSLWITNIAGAIIGLITVIRNVKCPIAWMGMVCHALQILGSLCLILVGTMAK